MYLGDFTTSNTVYVYFNTFDSNDPSASVTLTGLAVTDIEIYKDGSVTQRSSDAGYTLLDTDGIDFDGTTGIHGFSVDLSDNTDAGFYAAGSEYTIVVASVTVDGATVNFVACSFSIERTGGALALIKAGNIGANVTQWLGSAAATPTVAGVPEVDLTHVAGVTTNVAALATGVDAIQTAVITNAAGVDIAADIIALKAETVLIVADTGELQTDWVNGGRLDTLLDTAATAGDPWSTAVPGAYGAGTAGSILGALPDVTAGAAGGVFIAGTNAATTVTTSFTTTFTGNLTGSVATLTGHTAQTGDTYALANGATGFAAIDTVVDALPTLAEILAGGDVDGYTLEETLKLCLAALEGKLSGATGGAATIVFRAADDSKARITATVDALGNRTSVTLDATG